MALSAEQKRDIIDQYQRGNNDTGSPEVQIALLSEEIRQLTDHFSTHKQDNHSRQGLLRKVNERRKLLSYLKGKDVSRYQDLIGRLGLRK